MRAVRGIELFEQRAGGEGGPPVVVLHGGPGAHHDYLLPGFDRLAVGRTLIYYDQRGGGRSPVGREVPVGWREQVEDLEALRQLWGFPRLVLAGYSWGGLLALLYALEHPLTVDRLALISGAPVWGSARVEFERRFAERNSAPEIEAARRETQAAGPAGLGEAEYRRRMFDLSIAGYFHDWRMARALTPFRITGRTYEEVWHSLGDYDLRPRLGGLDLSAVVLHGESDPIPIANAEVVAELLRSPLHRLPQCGHVPYVEAPEAFTSLLDEFLPKSA